jgi:PKD repeat protein
VHTGRIRLVISLCAALGLALMTAPLVAAADDAAPVVAASVSSASPQEPATVIVSATFTDPDSTGGYSCQIDWGDGGVVAGTITDNTCTTAAHRYFTTATYAVVVSVTDGGGATGTDSASVHYSNVPPELRAPYFQGNSVMSSSMAEATISDSGTPETYTCSIDWGDVSGVQGGAYMPDGGQYNGPRCRFMDHRYSVAGAYSIVMTVTDSGGATGTTSLTETILPRPPVVASPLPSQTVHRTGTIWHVDETVPFTDPGGDALGPWTWTATWGDGATSSGTATAQGNLSLAHDYTRAGSYSPQIKVQSLPGAIGYGGFSVTALDEGPIVVSGSQGTTQVTEGQPATFYWAATDVSNAIPFSVHVDWGDGSVSDFADQTGRYALTHTYVADQPLVGNHGSLYRANLTVTDALGLTGSAGQDVFVNDLAPAVTAPTSISVPEGNAPITVTLGSFTDASVGPWQIVVTPDSSLYFKPTGWMAQAPSAIQITWDPRWPSTTLYLSVVDRSGMMGVATIHISTANTAPTITSVTVTPNPQVEGSPVSVVTTFSDPGLGTAEQYTCAVNYGDGWNLGGSVSGNTCTSAGHIYRNLGTYTATVTLTDWNGGTATATTVVNVLNDAPIVSQIVTGAARTGSITSVSASFTDRGQPLMSETYRCTVDYGDGSGPQAGAITAARCVGPNHVYSTAGTYVASITVVDSNGGVGTATGPVTVTSSTPTLSSVYITPSPAFEGGPVAVVGTFTAPGLGTGETFTCSVDYGDASGSQTGSITGGTCTGARHLYRGLGPYSVSVTVSDSHGNAATGWVTVTLPNDPPAISAVAVPGSVSAGASTAVSASFTDRGQSVTDEGYSCTVDYGDGTGPEDGEIGGQWCLGPDHVFAREGTYTITVRVADSNGGASSATGHVTVLNGAPVVTAATSNYHPREPETVVASATFTDTESDTETYVCAVDYGDATSVAGVVSGLTCTAPQHQYRTSGTYAVTVTVTDSNGYQGSSSVYVDYTNTPPWLGGFGLDGDTRFGSKAHAVVAVVDPGQVIETYTCTIDYGDGSPVLSGEWVPTGWVDDLPRCVFPDHIYPAVGSYTLTATVTDSGGASSSVQWEDSILPAIPYIQSLSLPSSVSEGTQVAASAAFLPTALNETYTCTVDYGEGSGPLAGVVTGPACQGPRHTYGHPGGYLVTLRVESSGGLWSSWTAMVSVANVDPTVAPKSVPTTATAGAAYAASVSFADPGWAFGETYACLIDYGDGYIGPGVISGQVCQGPQHYYSWKGTYQIVATVTDESGAVGSYAQSITVYNARPIVASVTAPDSVLGGASLKASAEFVPTGRTETYTCTVDYGDGTGAQAAAVTGTNCQGPSHTYRKLRMFTITVTVKGSITGSGAASRAIGVSPPPIAVGSVSLSDSAVEGSSVTTTAGFTPTGLTETYRCTVDYGDDLGTQTGTISGTTCIGPKHKLGRGGSTIVTVSIYGSTGTYGTSSKSITVTNVAPIFTKVTIPSAAKIGTVVSVSATFTDPGVSEVYGATWIWGDGTTTSIFLPANTRSFSASHTYSTAGDYYVYAQLGDSADYVYYDSELAVYDPARTVVGSGTFASVAGSCKLSAKCANASAGSFSLSASYAKGATKPTVCFSFRVNGLALTATGADWLIAVNGTAEIGGTGTVNGVSGYKFWVYASDASPDALTITIQDSKGNVVYSNSSALKTGSITVK